MSDKAFQIIFSIPQLDSAFMRNPSGGGRLKIDIDQATVDQVNAMLDETYKRGGVVFAGAIVMVEAAEPQAEPPAKVRTWRDKK